MKPVRPRAFPSPRWTLPRDQHVVFLLHLWVFVPLLLVWPFTLRDAQDGSQGAKNVLIGLVVGTFLYLVVRTRSALHRSESGFWQKGYAPVDVVLVTALLWGSGGGPMSNVSLLYFLAIAEAASSLKVRFTAMIGVACVGGLTLVTLVGGVPSVAPVENLQELLRVDAFNVIFRVMFFIVLSSLMAYQAYVAASVQATLELERERRRIAHEMHDGVQGSLVAIATRAEVMARQGVPLADELRGSATAAASELRFVVDRLRRPPEGDDWAEPLTRHLERLCQLAGARISVSTAPALPSLRLEAEHALVRAAQEAVTNALKHGRPTEVGLSLRAGDGWVELTVEDDGAGMPASGSEESGLAGVRERLDSVGGELRLGTSAGGGVRFQARVPVN